MLSIVPDIMSDPKKSNLQIDLNNIDINQLVQIVNEYQNTAIKVVLVVGALIIAGVMFNDYHGKDLKLRARMSEMQQKLDVIASHQAADKSLNDFKASFPKGIEEEKIITQITAFATAHHVTISSLAPFGSQDMGLYDVIKVTLTGVASDYKAMVLFLRDMEMSSYLFRLDSWSGAQSSDRDGGVVFTMGVSVIRVHL